MSTPPRILVLGAGSIGERHATNLAAAGASVEIMDADERRSEALAPSGIQARPLNLTCLGDYEGIVVATPTSLHHDHALAALDTGAKVLVEKPLALSGSQAVNLADIDDGRLCVGYNLRYHGPVQRAVKAIHEGAVGDITSLRLWFGSWLPDWRPATDYRTSYSAQRELGGGVLFDAIHELDLMLWILRTSDIDVVGAIVARLGPLELDVEDTVHSVLRTADGRVAIALSLDYLARRYRRGLECTGSAGTLRLDWAREVIEIERAADASSEVADTPISVSYELEDAAFLAWVRGGPPLPVDGSLGAASVALAEAIRDAAT